MKVKGVRQRHGKGKYTDGAECYEGDWENDALHGSDCMVILAGGAEYKGDMQGHMYHGLGRYVWSDGATYEGGTRIFVSVGYLGASVSSEQHLAQGSRLGQLYQSVTNRLLRRGPLFRPAPPLGGTRWRRLKQLKGTRFPQLILGGACGFGIPFKRLSSSSSSSLSRRPATLVNYYRGFEVVCRKARLVETLRQTYPDAAARDAWLPPSFVFFPARPEQSEVAHFRAAFAKDMATRGRSMWILKPSDGSKGREIFVTDREDEVLATFATEETEANTEEAVKDAGEEKTKARATTNRRRTGTIAWVVQRYITDPLLLPGGRKFDMRVWVLVDAEYKIFVHREGVLRTTSVPFSLAADKLDDPFVHLSNHCIQTKCPSYGQYEPTNEMFYAEFDAHLSRAYRVRARRGCGELAFGRGEFDVRRAAREDEDEQEQEQEEQGGEEEDGDGDDELFRPARLREVIVPQLHRIVAMTLMSAKDQMCNAPGAAFASFNLFGFDFMVNDSCRVQLIEINSSPAVADRLLKEVVGDLCEAAIVPFFSEGGAASVVESGGFELVDCAKWVPV